MIGMFPSVNKDEGFLNDNDREILKKNGAEIAKGTLELLYDDEFNIYRVFCLPKDRLYLVHVVADKEGKALRPSMLISKVKKIFPKLQEESDLNSNNVEISNKEATFEQLLLALRKYKNGEQIDNIWFDIYNIFIQDEEWKPKLENALKGLDYTNEAEKLTSENLRKLYGEKLKISVSKLEKYKNCPFSFYMQYGLRIKEKQEYEMRALDTGSFMHEVIDEFFNRIKNIEIQTLEKEEIARITNEIIEERLKFGKNRIFTSSPKFIILTNRLKKVLTESIEYLVYQMKYSNFKTIGTEVEFRKKIGNIEIEGKIDRIDIAENEDRKIHKSYRL